MSSSIRIVDHFCLAQGQLFSVGTALPINFRHTIVIVINTALQILIDFCKIGDICVKPILAYINSAWSISSFLSPCVITTILLSLLFIDLRQQYLTCIQLSPFDKEKEFLLDTFVFLHLISIVLCYFVH